MPTYLLSLNLPWESPTLGIRFVMGAEGSEIYYPNGNLFEDPQEWLMEREQAQSERDRAWAKLKELGIDPSQL